MAVTSTVYPAAITINPKPKLDATLAVVGSKSVTNRALILAALAPGQSRLQGALIAHDTLVMCRALRMLGFTLVRDGTTLQLVGQGGRIPTPRAKLDLALSGTSLRFLSALVALGQGQYQLDGNARMRQRPIGDLLDSLAQLGVKSRSCAGYPPLHIEADGIGGGTTRINGSASSQFLSALLMVAPYARGTIAITVKGTLQSKPFVDLTLAMMAEFGVQVQREGYQHFVLSPQHYQARAYAIEGDATAAGYFWAAAAISGGKVSVRNVGSASNQGDKALAHLLARMGCRVDWQAQQCTLHAPADGKLRGGSFDLNAMPDQAQTLAVVALFADSPVHIRNVWNLRIKETDRIHALACELRKFGAQVEESYDALHITPPLHYPSQVTVDTYGDHRMAMAFALAGLRLPGVTIMQPGCVAKTFPDYFARLEAL